MILDPEPKFPGIRPWYDTRANIVIALQSLKKLELLLQARHTAGYQREERLNEWVILGSYRLDSCGNCMKATGWIPKVEFPWIPDVQTLKQFNNFLNKYDKREYKSTWWTISSDLPRHDLICPECKKGWTIENCFDVVRRTKTETWPLKEFEGKTLAVVKAFFAKRTDAEIFMQSDLLIRNDGFIDKTPQYPNPKDDYERRAVKNETGWVRDRDGINDLYAIQDGDEGFFNVWTYYHRKCNGKHLDETEKKAFEKVFTDAGFEKFDLRSIPNRYSQSEYDAPWYNVFTQYGLIIIGWRKRVINIDWSDFFITAADYGKKFPGLLHLFLDEDVTKSQTYIHAWGFEKATSYLKMIKEYMERIVGESYTDIGAAKRQLDIRDLAKAVIEANREMGPMLTFGDVQKKLATIGLSLVGFEVRTAMAAFDMAMDGKNILDLEDPKKYSMVLKVMVEHLETVI